jgi:DNA-binding MarR family transcriptional regulator
VSLVSGSVPRVGSDPQVPEEALEAIRSTWQIMAQRLSEVLERQGLSHSGFLFLKAIQDAPAPLSELSRLLGLSPATITELTDRLAIPGFVERIPDPHDRRVTLARLTPLGRQTLQKARQAHRELLRRAFLQLPEDDLRGLVRGLTVLRQALEAVPRGVVP